MASEKKYPAAVYNFVSLLGVGLALFAVAATLILMTLSRFLGGENPYLGIFTFLVFPGILVAGLILIPIGMVMERRRRERGVLRSLVIDLGKRPHRNAALFFAVGTSIFLLVTTLGLYGGYEYTESVEFCGEVCHQVMEPEHTAYLGSPHARVKCVECHIGPGADWYVKSKISGARQVFKTMAGTYPRPIPTPIEALRPAQEVCEQCHWPDKFYSANMKVFDHFLSDDANTHWQIKMLLRVGGRVSPQGGVLAGIHWHVDEANEMMYVADSTRADMEYLAWRKDGREVVYTAGGDPVEEGWLAEKRRSGELRRLDCMDCHNRPAHIYHSPVDAVNQAIAAGDLDRSIPAIKRNAVEALSKEYETREAAHEGIRSALLASYDGDAGAIPESAIRSVLDLYDRNMFPEMKVRWDKYPTHLSHLDFPGCFRCHGSDLETAEGETIRSDCSMCHVILAQGPEGQLEEGSEAAGLVFRHPVDIDGAWQEMLCSDCHVGDASLY